MSGTRHDTSQLEIDILSLVKDQIGPRICPDCAVQTMVNVLAQFTNCAIAMNDRPITEATATALEIIAGHCRSMEPMTNVHTVTATRPH